MSLEDFDQRESAEVYNLLSSVETSLGNKNNAWKYQRLCEKHDKHREKGIEIDIPGSMNQRASMLLAERKSSEAKEILLKAIELNHRNWDVDHPSFSTLYYNMGYAEHYLGNESESKHYFQKAYDIDLKQYGPDHPELARYKKDGLL